MICNINISEMVCSKSRVILLIFAFMIFIDNRIKLYLHNIFQDTVTMCFTKPNKKQSE